MGDYINLGYEFDFPKSSKDTNKSVCEPPVNLSAPKSNILSMYDDRKDDPLATACLGIINIVNNALSHPCMVLRRQCQVHQLARKQHLTPFTLLPVTMKMISKDGFLTLWKGSLGCSVLWCVSRVSECVISDVFSLPRTLIPNGSTEKFWKHIYLKAATAFVTTPFIISSFIETVRSCTGFSFDDSRPLDVIFRGIDRLRSDLFGATDSSRRIWIGYLTFPTVFYCTGHFLIQNWCFNKIYIVVRRYVSRRPVTERTRFHTIMPDIFATMGSVVIADAILYPFETVLHRLFIQGTRTLIDNLDTGASATSVAVKYTGFFDCFNSIVAKEGFSALYSGIGALALQFSLNFCVLRGMHILFEHVNRAMGNGPSTLPHYVPNNNPVGPSAQFAAASRQEFPAASNLGFPSFAETSQSNDLWPIPGYSSPPCQIQQIDNSGDLYRNKMPF